MGIISSKRKFDLEDRKEKILRQVTRLLSGRAVRFRIYGGKHDIIRGLQGREGLKEN